MAAPGPSDTRNNVARAAIAFTTAQQLEKRIFVGYSDPVEHGGRRTPVALWYTWYWDGNSVKIQLYDGPGYTAKLLRPQTKFPPNLRTFPTILLRLDDKRWKECARKLYTAQFVPPTCVHISGNGTFVPRTIETWDERMPDIYGDGLSGHVWISDAECEARYYDLSIEYPMSVLERMNRITCARFPRGWVYYSNKRPDDLQGDRHFLVDRLIDDTIVAVEQILKKIGTEPDEVEDADTLEMALKNLHAERQLDKYGTSTWKQVQNIREIIGTSDVEENYEHRMIWYNNLWARRYGKDR